jgi:DNA-binding Lrp family transcriptional regulator
MQEGLLMTQADRDRLVTLKKAKRKLITQGEAAEELGVSRRHVKRMLKALKKRGDQSVIHGLRGKPSNRRVVEATEKEAVKILSAEIYEGFGPTLAAEYLSKLHGIEVSKETLRQWMIRGKLWRAKPEKVKKVHAWRPRRSRFGELVQWDTSEHDWLEGRGEKLYLIVMIDDASSRLFARFVRHDSTEENMKLLWSYLEKFGRPIAFYTDKASLFQTAERRKRDEPGVEKDAVEMPPTQIGRGLRELGVVWIAAHSPQAKGRVERNFKTAQDRLVKGLRVAGVKTIEQANQYLEEEYLVWWERELTVEPANPDDAHRPLDKSHNLAASLSHVETRQVRNDYTLRLDSELYQIEPQAVVSGLRGANVRVERRLDDEVAVRYGEKYLPVKQCVPAEKRAPAPKQAGTAAKRRQPRRGSAWDKNFDLRKAPKIWQVQESGRRRGDAD